MRSNATPFRRFAFTLVELLVVISIFVLLLALAVPAFSSMMYSSEQSLAEQSLRIALGTARTVAVGSPAGKDAAAVFMYDSESKKTTIVVCTKAGEFSDMTVPGPNGGRPAPISREVFAAAPGVEPIQMTAGWTVRGYAAAYTMEGGWYNDGTYTTNALQQQGNWVFPETSFYDDTRRDEGGDRQTFMVRFEGGTGMVKTSDPRAVVVVSPSESLSFRSNWPQLPAAPNPAPIPGWDYLMNNPLNVTHEPDPVKFVQRVISWPQPTNNYSASLSSNAGAITLATKRAIIGNISTDTILTKPVGQLALCNEQKLATAIGVRTDNDTGCIYQNMTDPIFVTRNGSAFTPADIGRVNQWIEGHLYDNNNELIDSDCRVFTVQRYLGWLQEVTGTRGGLGVGS